MLFGGFLFTSLSLAQWTASDWAQNMAISHVGYHSYHIPWFSSYFFVFFWKWFISTCNPLNERMENLSELCILIYMCVVYYRCVVRTLYYMCCVLQVCQSKPECGRQSLTELLIRPVQRLPSVSLLLGGNVWSLKWYWQEILTLEDFSIFKYLKCKINCTKNYKQKNKNLLTEWCYI